MAAYAALVSLLNNVEQMRNHPRLSTSFDRKQVNSLLRRVDFLLDFIESYNSYGGSREELERQIASAAHAAEDVIESHLVDQILAGSTEKGSNFLEKKVIKILEKMQFKKSPLQKIMEDIDSIKEKILKVKKEKGFKAELTESPMLAASSRTLTVKKSDHMVGFDSYLTQLLDELTGHRSDRQIIPIVGMGGIGKTTLSRNAYDSLLVVQYFDVRAWITISQGYNVREILFETFSCLSKSDDGMMDRKTDDELGEQLHKTLSGRRYLIVLDDMWSIEAWDKIKFFFPDNHNKSRIIVTTRIFDVANHFGSMRLALDFLDDDRSWKLFCEKVFPQEVFPPELEEIGMKIVKKCKGLPLSIVVIGGLLKNSSRTQGQWENVEKDIRSILNTAEDHRCLKLLSLSYSHLPVRLKPCFLYFGIFPEGDVIRVSRLIRLWVAEGFIKPNKDKSLEEIGEGYIKDLVDRNLISVQSLRWNGKLKACRIHDLLRDLCISVAEKEKFLCATSVHDDTRDEIDRQRRIVIHDGSPRERVFHTLKSKSLARSIICKDGDLLPVEPRLLRVLVEVYNSESIDNTFLQVNLRFLSHASLKAPIDWLDTYHLPSSISLLWNVQTLIMKGRVVGVVAPSEIWKMPQLRHLKFKSISLPDPPPFSNGFVLHNLQTLCRVLNFRFSEEACKRMPNIKKLHVSCGDFSSKGVTWSYYCTRNFVFFNKLESLHYHFVRHPNQDDLLQSLVFPNSLKKLTLVFCELEWNDLTIIGSLPHLEALKLRFSGSGPNWNPVEGEFLRLKYLQIYWCNIVCWNADNSHFPVLENLVLEYLNDLNEIPSGIGDIQTLECICLVNCRISAAFSAIKILEEQESFGNQGLQVKVHFVDTLKLVEFMEQVEQEGLTGLNFQIEVA